MKKMAIDDFDSDDGPTGDYRYSKSSMQRSGSSSLSTKPSILKSSKKLSQYSDEDDDDNFNSSSRLSNRNRYDSPLNSHRSDITSAKPPSGRLQPMGTSKGLSNTTSDYSMSKRTNGYGDYDSTNKYDSLKSKPNLPAITYTSPSSKNTFNDSDDSITERYNKFKKNTSSAYDNEKSSKYDSKIKDDYGKYDGKYDSKIKDDYGKYDSKYDSKIKDDYGKYDKFDGKLEVKYDRQSSRFDTKGSNSFKEDSKYDSKYDSKFEAKYDTYDEDDIKRDSTGNKFYRSESPLKNASSSLYKTEPLSLKGSSKSARSNSLDRLNSTSAYNGITNASTSGVRLPKYSSTNNINGDNASDKSYTINSLNSTSMSIREAKSRSYLVGSLSALNGKGLLSNEELDRHFIDRKARVLLSTWNMGGVKKLPSNLEDLVLPDTIQTMPDIYVIAVQEFDLNQKEWEVGLQEHIGPTHVKLSSYYYGSLGIVLFIKRELIWFSSIVEFEHISLKAVNAPARTKASLLISFQLFGTLMCFISSHFTAGEGNIEYRIENYQTTIQNIKLPKKLLSKPKSLSTDGTDNFDIVFWLGDFNFLVNKEREKIEKKVNNLRERRGNNYEEIINHDELNQVMAQDKAFKHFLEGRITFEPTYKYDINSDNYDTSDKCRIPSYCDRILYRSRQKGAISCSYYDTIKEMKMSDHRPVFGLYEVTIRPGVDKVQLSYGDFDRQVYAAGYQKRQMFRAYDVGFENTANNQEAKKSPCVIQ